MEGLHNLTFDEFVELPEELHKKAELFNGVVHVSSPSWHHQRVGRKLMGALDLWVTQEAGQGEVMYDYLVRIDERSGYKPDVAWYRPEDCPPPGGGYPVGPPTIVVEVLSPSTRLTDLLRKPMGYAAIGVHEVWLVDVDEQQVVILNDPEGFGYNGFVEVPADGAITSPLLPGFSLPVADVFAE